MSVDAKAVRLVERVECVAWKDGAGAVYAVPSLTDPDDFHVVVDLGGSAWARGSGATVRPAPAARRAATARRCSCAASRRRAAGGPVMPTTVVSLRGRHRENGGQAPEGVVSIGRAMGRGGWRLPASEWANPFPIGRHGTREEVIAGYREDLLLRPELRAALPELRGRVLGCWCMPLPCHGDVLVELTDAGA